MGSFLNHLQPQMNKASLDDQINSLIDDPEDVRGLFRVLTGLINEHPGDPNYKPDQKLEKKLA